MSDPIKNLSPEGRDQVKAAAARLALSAFASIMERRGETPEVLALVAEGLFAGIAHHAWRNRTDKVNRARLERTLRRMLRQAVKDATR